MLYKQFYSELGKLLYAIADVDGMISKKEKEVLKEIVRKELAPKENHRDEFGTDAAFYTEFEFDVMEDAIYEPDAAFESFINYIEDHKTAIDHNMIRATRHVASKLADAFHHTNVKEKKYLQILNKKLDQISEDNNKLLK